LISEILVYSLIFYFLLGICVAKIPCIRGLPRDISRSWKYPCGGTQNLKPDWVPNDKLERKSKNIRENGIPKIKEITEDAKRLIVIFVSKSFFS